MKKKTLNVKGSMVPVMAAVVLTMGWMLLPVPAAWAVPVVLENGPATFSASDMQGEAIGDVEASSFQLIGKTQDGKAVLFLDNQFVTVDMAAVREAVPQTAEKDLPEYDSEAEELSKGSKGEEVAAMQEALKKLGLLEGSADGSFGGQSEQAVTAFQAGMGLEESGSADALLQLLILSAAEESIVIKDPTASFDPIKGKTSMDLQPLYDAGLVLEYDDIEGVGFIYDGTPVEYTFPAETDIERGEMSLKIGLYVEQQKDGAIELTPAVALSCSSVRRVMMQEIVLKAGDSRTTAAIENITVSADGAMTKEEGVVFLDEEGAAVLAGARKAGELKLRVYGKYGSYDISVTKKKRLAAIAAAGKIR